MKRARWLALAAVLGIASLYIGTRAGVWLMPSPSVHPLTGRQIAGIATDAAWMDRASRKTEEDPARALALVGIRPGTVVADIGAGSGYMTMRIVPLVGPAGKIYATTSSRRWCASSRARYERRVSQMSRSSLGPRPTLVLPAKAIDVALLIDVYHEFRYPQAMLESLRRSLKSDGQLVLIEYRKEDPSIPIAATHRMSVVELRSEIEAGGFVFDHAIEELPRQHLIVFRRAPS